MQSESDDLRPGSSLGSAMGHSTATHKHKSPMRRLIHGLKRLNSYSNENSDSDSSDEDERSDAAGEGGGGSEEFVERHRVLEIRFNYESRSLHFLHFPGSDPSIRLTSPEAVFPDPRQVPPQIRRTLTSSRFAA